MKSGDILAMIGANGSGKSTSFKILTDQIMPSEGIARIEGKNA